MKYRNLGNSGLKVSVIGLGTNQFGGKVDEATTKAIIHKGLDLGVTFIDTADMYQKGKSEIAIGKAIKGIREQVLIATKFFYPSGDGPNNKGGSRYHIIKAVEASLKRLDTDYIDLYQMHSWDEDTPIEETMRALDVLVKSGKVRYIGASNFSSWQLTQANAIAKELGAEMFVSIQPHYHMLEREIEKELVPAAKYFNIGILPYFPLAGGFLTGKYTSGQPAPEGSRGEQSQYVQKYMNENYYGILGKLTKFAESRSRKINELAHAWLLAEPQVSSVISGATRVEHLEANAASADWELTAEEKAEVDKLLAGE